MHSIRLRQPWRQQWSEQADGRGPSHLACYRRSFNLPTGLEPDQSVLLVIEPKEKPISAGRTASPFIVRAMTLNDRPLTPLVQCNGHTCADLSAELLPFNQLEVVGALAEVGNYGSLLPPITDLVEVRIEIS